MKADNCEKPTVGRSSSHYAWGNYQVDIAYIKGQRYEADWLNLTAELAGITRVYGPTPVMMNVNKILLIANNDPNLSHIAMISASDSSTNPGSGNKMAWEFLRQFMNKGPDKLPLTAKYDLANDMSHGKISYTYQESLSRRSFWPIYNKTDDWNAKSADIFFWPFKLIFFIPNILTDILWHKMVTSIKGHSSIKDSLPSENECDKKWITADSIAQVLLPGEKIITYAVAKERGALRE